MTVAAGMYVFSPTVLFGLQFLGLFPVSVDHLPLRGDVVRVSKPRVAYCALLVVFYLVAVWMLKTVDKITLANHNTFQITSLCGLLAAFLSALVAIMVAALKVNQKIQMVERMREIDFLLQRKLQPPRHRCVSLLSISCGLITYFSEAIHILTDGKSTLLMAVTYLIFDYFKIVILFSILEVMELVLAVKERFKLVNERVLEVVMRNRSKQLIWTAALPCVETFTMPQEMKISIPSLSEIHWNLCCIVYDINAIYGYHLVSAMVFIFAHLVYRPYLIFFLFRDLPRSLRFMVLTALWLALIASELLMLVLPCSMAVEEAKKTVVIVTKLMGHKMAKPLFDELDSFADQLFHRDVEFTASGLFTLQTSIIVSVASAVTTYMAILIQFQTSGDEAEESTSEMSTVTAVSVVSSGLQYIANVTQTEDNLL